VLELTRRLVAKGKTESFIELFNHRTRPSKVFTAPRLLGATARLLLRRGTDRRALLREVGGLVTEDARRRRLNRRPAYVEPGESVDAGQTEVDDRTPDPVP
jgi:hypothetical protein